MQTKPVELSAVQRLKYKTIHSGNQCISLFTRMALHSCVHYILLTKQKNLTANALPLPVTHNKALNQDVSKVAC